jgi:hypothetical protein
MIRAMVSAAFMTVAALATLIVALIVVAFVIDLAIGMWS